MSFLAPWAFFLGAIAPVIVLLYLLKLRRRRASVSTLIFWQRALEENRQTALLQRLRNPLSLLLHLLIFALLLLALAKPVFDSAIQAGTSTVLIVDNRARMRARQNGLERFSEATRSGLSLLKQAGSNREFAILTGGAESRVISPFSSDAANLARLFETLSATDSSGSLEPALRLAANLLDSRQGDRRIIVLTSPSNDLPFDSIDGIPVEIRAFGSSADNTAITRFATRPLPSDPHTIEVFLEIQHFGEQPAEGSLELSRDGVLLDVRPVRVLPGEPLRIFFPALNSSKGSSRGLLTARLTREDALLADNVAFAVLPQRPLRNVLLVTRGNWFLEKLLQADTRLRYELLAPESFRPSMQGAFDVVIFDRFAPADFSLSEMRSSALFIGEAPFVTGTPVEQPIITEVSENHSLLAGVNLRNVTIGKGFGLTVPRLDGWRFESLLGSFDHALLVTGQDRRRRVAVLGFDLLESDLPLRIAFPLLIGNLVQWLGGDNADGLMSLRAGEVHQPETPTIVAGPFAELSEGDAEGTSILTWQPLRNGFYQLGSGDSARWVAVNTFDSSESNLIGSAESPASDWGSGMPGWIQAATGAPWQYLALTGALLLLLEWRLFHRRRTE